MGVWRYFISMGLTAVLLTGCSSASRNTTRRAAPPAKQVRAIPIPLTIESAEIDPTPLLARDATVALSLGAGAVQVVAVAAAMEGDRFGGFVALDPQTCMLAFARGSQEIDDLDIVAFDDAGTPLAADQATDPRPAILLCPPHPRRVYVSGRVAAGHGTVALGVQSVAPPIAERLAALFGARVASKDEVRAQAWPGLDRILSRRRQALGGHWEEVRKAAVSVNPKAPVYVSTPLPDSRCLDVVVVPNEETANLDVTLADETGRELARAPNVGKDRTALICTPVETTITVGIRPHDGYGVVAVVLSRSAAGDQSELAARPDALRAGPLETLEKVRERSSAILSRAGLEAKSEVFAGRLESGQATSTPLTLAAGCSRIDVLAGTPVSGLRAALWDASNDLVASTEGGEQLTLFGCVANAQRATLEVLGVGRPGPFAIESRKEKAPPPELLHHPVAAARVLGRANGAGRTVTVQDLSEVRRIDLEENKRAEFDTTVAVGSCMNIVAATQPGASGLELTATEAATGAIQGTSRGNVVTQLRVCSRSRALRLKIYARVDSGKAEGVAARYVTPFENP